MRVNKMVVKLYVFYYVGKSKSGYRTTRVL